LFRRRLGQPLRVGKAGVIFRRATGCDTAGAGKPQPFVDTGRATIRTSNPMTSWKVAAPEV
jgi:hypothetical protein